MTEKRVKRNEAEGIAEKAQRKHFLVNRNISPSAQYQLDLLYPDTIGNRNDLRHIPNDVARSSIFTTRRRNIPRETLQQAELFHFNNHISVVYTGIELRAEDDELVWLQILNYAQKVPLGESFKFTIRQLITDLGWSIKGDSYERARSCISRLKANEVMFRNTKAYGTSGAFSLISNYKATNESDGKPTHYEMWIDTTLIYLFAGNTFTSHKWEIYRKLTPIARRLADQLESHKVPYPISLSTFKELCSSQDKNPRSWRNNVKAACEELVQNGIMEQIFIADDLIHSVPQITKKASD